MADVVLGRQPDPFDLPVLHQPEAPRLLQPVLQAKQELADRHVARQGGTARVRDDEASVPGHAGPVQRLQAEVQQRDEQDAADEEMRLREDRMHGNGALVRA